MASNSSNPSSLQSIERDVQTPQQHEGAGLEKSIVLWEAPDQTGASGTITEWPEWLPEGWSVEVRTRTTGKTAGVKDRFYYDPVSHRQFRSRKEVEHFLQTGTKRRYTPQSRKMKSETPTPQQSAERFDFDNPPSKVSWVLTNASEGLWTPYINGEEVPETTRSVWAATMEDIMNGTYKF